MIVVRASLWMGALALVGGCAPDVAFVEDGWRQASFVQSEHEMVDVLWVIDDSSSFMAHVQRNLAHAAPLLVGPLDGLDVQMAVVTTTLGAPLEPFAWSGADADVAWLAERLQVGASGSDQERGLQAARDALAPPLGFVRPEGHLVVVFVSDEEDCSHQGALGDDLGAACYTDARRLDPVEDFVAFFTGLHGGAANRFTAVALGAGTESSCADPVPQERYARVARASGGRVLDLCGDAGVQLVQVGEIASGRRSAFRLPDPALEASLQVSVDGVASDRFAYQPRTWLLEFPVEALPPPGAVIHLTYRIDPTVWTIAP